jgi:hypothetical protein
MFGPCYGLRLPWFSRFRRQKSERSVAGVAGAIERVILAIGQNRAIADIAFLLGARDRLKRVTKETFDDYRCHLDRSLLKSPNQTFALTVKAWRTAKLAVKNRPRVSVAIPDRRKYWVYQWDRFPETLRRDCQAWCERLAGRDLLDDAPFRPVRPATVAHREWQIRSFASALVRKGRNPATLTCLKDLVEIDAFKEGLRFFLDREGTPTTAIADLASSLKAIARHHVHIEQRHLDQMGTIIRNRLAPGRRGLTEINRTRLRPFDDRGNIIALLKLPDELMRQARRYRNLQRGAVRAQLAVVVEVLLMAPIRMSNLVKLDIERNLVRLGQGRALHRH